MGLFDGPPPRTGGRAGGGHKRETPRLRWLARALRDSVAERVWAPAAAAGGGGEGGGGGGGAVEAMKLLLEDLAHSYQGRRASARRALQSVLASSPAGKRGSVRAGASAAAGAAGIAVGAGRVAWTPAKGRKRGGGAEEEEGEGDEERVVVLQKEADEEQCGWLFWCHALPSWTDVSVGGDRPSCRG